MDPSPGRPDHHGDDSAAEGAARESARRAEALMHRARWQIVAWYLVTVLTLAGFAIGLSLWVTESVQVIPGAVIAWLFLCVMVKLGAAAVRGVWRSTAYPHRHWVRLKGCLPTVLVINLILGLLAVTSMDGAAAFGAFFLVWLLFSSPSVSASYYYVRVTPYFRSRVGETTTYCSGHGLARHMLELDELARTLGVTPLSEFGWNDDLAGEELVWHDAARGLKTVNALLAHLQVDEFAESEQAEVIDDLKRIANDLGRADQQSIPFCLLLQHGDATSGWEHDRRKGTFF